ncbi:MAG: helix-turn-helix transcriptional regulator [Clostridia bacterium]|nr:helix-turn-helix transcriptional regulator [Clostridia bacterium]
MKTQANDIQILECGIFDSAAFYSNKRTFRKRTLQYFEIEFFISCRGKSTIDGQSLQFLPQTVFLGKPGQERSGAAFFKCYYIHLQINPENKYYSRLSSCPSYYYCIDAQKYFSVFEAFIYYHNVKELNVESDILYAKLLELFYYLSEDAKVASNRSETVRQASNPAVLAALSYIQSNYQEKLDLEFFAKKFNYSKNYFQSIFKAAVGRTPQEYVANVRIEKAKELLNDPSIPLTQIPKQCGFRSQSYFNYLFKKKLNVSPLEYRKGCVQGYFST